MADLTQMQEMIKSVVVNGKQVYLVVPNIKQFKVDVVTQMTTRPNKRRVEANRLHWLLHTFARNNCEGMKGKKGMQVHLLGEVIGKDTLFRNEKGHYVTMEKLMEAPDLAAAV